MLGNDSVIRLYPYQRRFFADRARVVVGDWSRQAGKDFAAACKACDDAFEKRRAWYIVSMTQRQADATFAKCKAVWKAIRLAAKVEADAAESEQAFVDYDADIDQEFASTARTLTFPGGGSVTALPGKDPDTLAGLTGNVIFTEFGLFRAGGYPHWRVIFPLVTRGFQVVVISTPRGKNTKFYDLVNSPEKYSVHRVDIHQAVAEGLPLVDNEGKACTIEDLREQYGDETGWRREYELEFSGDLDALIAWGLLDAAAQLPGPEDSPAFRLLRVEGGNGWTADFFADLAKAPSPGRLELGWDVARHKHFSPLWVNWNPGVANAPRRLVRLVLMHGCEFALQREIVRAAMDARYGGVGCGDSTGLGMDSNETLTNVYGERWEGVNFGGRSKAELASLLRTCYGDRDQALPPFAGGEHKFIAADLYALQREGGTDKLVITETANPLLADSHCDIAWANALSRKAGARALQGGYLWVA